MSDLRLELTRFLERAREIDTNNVFELAVVKESITKKLNRFVFISEILSELENMYNEGILEKDGSKYIIPEKITRYIVKRKVETILKKHKDITFSLNQLAKNVGVSKKTISRIIKDLECEGKIEIVKRRPKMVRWKHD